MKKRSLIGRLNMSLIALLLLGMGYLGLMLFLGTSSPFLLVRGTSMEPTLHAGDLLLTRSVPVGEINAGDIISFRVPDDAQERLKMPANAVHRVMGIDGEKGQLVLVTKGDNSDVDPFKVQSGAVHGVVVKNLGPVGRPILLLTNLLANRAMLLLVGLPILTFVLIVLASLWMAPNKSPEHPLPGSAALAETSPAEINNAIEKLAVAVAEYGAHLQSHTAVVKHLAGTSDGLEQAVHQQNEVLAGLAEVVRELNGQNGRDGSASKAQASGNGAKQSRNRTAKAARREPGKKAVAEREA